MAASPGNNQAMAADVSTSDEDWNPVLKDQFAGALNKFCDELSAKGNLEWMYITPQGCIYLPQWETFWNDFDDFIDLFFTDEAAREKFSVSLAGAGRERQTLLSIIAETQGR